MSEKTHFLLSIEDQSVIWPTNGPYPEIDIGCETVLGTFERRTDAFLAVDKYLAMVGAKALWSDVRPIETCACCQSDLDTRKRHMTLVMTEETVNQHDPEMPGEYVDGGYPARFCTDCVPLDGEFLKKMGVTQ